MNIIDEINENNDKYLDNIRLIAKAAKERHFLLKEFQDNEEKIELIKEENERLQNELDILEIVYFCNKGRFRGD